jgi:uncharacterized protein YggE
LELVSQNQIIGRLFLYSPALFISIVSVVFIKVDLKYRNFYNFLPQSFDMGTIEHATPTTESPLIITVSGSSDLHHKAELAVMSITVSDTAATKEKASTSISKTISQILSMLGAKDPKQGSDSSPGSGIARWKIRTLSKTEYEYHGSMSKSVYRVTTSFEITFRDFALLGMWDSTLCNTPNAKVEEIKWTLTDATRKRLKTEGRKFCAEKAMHKARDFAEALGLERSAVRALELFDKGSHTTSTNGDHGEPRMRGASKISHDQGSHLVFANEEVRLQNNITIKCVAG